MTPAEWLDARTPPPPAHLALRIRSLLDSVPVTETDPASALAAAAERALAGLLAHDDRSRAIAADLLAIDALVTYACEAAAESGARADDLALWCADFAARLARSRTAATVTG